MYIKAHHDDVKVCVIKDAAFFDLFLQSLISACLFSTSALFAYVLSAFSTSAISTGSSSVPFTISRLCSASKIAMSFVRHGPYVIESFSTIFFLNFYFCGIAVTCVMIS